ncbi:HNH endonuclease [Salmonella enterica]|nr:HNH endonuclease [Salmonella enterica]
MSANPCNNPALLRELFAYDKVTGRLHHAKDKRGASKGAYADSTMQGQQRRTNVRVSGKNKPVPTRNIVWVMHHGPIPDGYQVVLSEPDPEYATHIEHLRLVPTSEPEFDLANVHLNLPVLSTLFQYSPESGRITRRSGRRAGQFADTALNDGLRVVSATSGGKTRQFSAARVAYALGTGAVLPDDVPLYHLNGDKLDNRLSNLACKPRRTLNRRKRIEAQIRSAQAQIKRLRADLAELNATEYA